MVLVKNSSTIIHDSRSINILVGNHRWKYRLKGTNHDRHVFTKENDYDVLEWSVMCNQHNIENAMVDTVRRMYEVFKDEADH